MAEQMLINLEFKRMSNMLAEEPHTAICLCTDCGIRGEHVDQLLETRYHAFDDEGNESDDYTIAYDLSYVKHLKCGSFKYGINALQIEKSLLDKFNVHVNGFFTSPEIHLISRVNPIPWESLSTIGFNDIQVPGIAKMFRECPNVPENIPEHLRDTLTYNDLVRHAFRSNILVEYIGLMTECIGFYKSPMTEPINEHLEIFKAQISERAVINDAKIAKLIRSVKCSLVKWAESVIDEQGAALLDFIEFLYSCAEKYYKNLRLDEHKFWQPDAGDYIHHLTTYAEMLRLASAVQGKSLKSVWDHLRRTTSDLARVVDSSLKKYFNKIINLTFIIKIYSREVEANKTTKQGTENVMPNTDCFICLENRVEDNARTEFYAFEKCSHGLYLCVDCADKLKICPWRCNDQLPQGKKRIIIMSNQ